MTTGTDGAAAGLGDCLLTQGARRLRPDDHFMIASETAASPMHVGALMLLGGNGSATSLVEAIRRQVADRLPATPLLCKLTHAPDGYDADVWVDVAKCDLAYHVTPVMLDRADDTGLCAFVASQSMNRLDLERPPFRIFVIGGQTDGRQALYFKMHHAVADGIGFQTVMGLLSDATPPAEPRRHDALLPDPAHWHALATENFARLAPMAEAHRQQRRTAKTELAALAAAAEPPRPLTPVLAMSGPTSTKRAYAMVSLPLARVKAVSKTLNASVNDIFLALAGTVMRRYLLGVNDLPDAPIVVNSARSYRIADHGAFGNRIVALHPHLATNVADPVQRLRIIQQEMAREMRRSPYDEAMLDAPEVPFGPRDRLARARARLEETARLLPGNITLSNVPGRAERLSYAGHTVEANYPVPILGSGRLLNVTSRRNADMLDMGVMTDGEKIPDPEPIARGMAEALAEYEHVAG